MVLNAEDLYNNIVKKLSPKERLRLAAMILNELLADDEYAEFSDNWSKRDFHHLTLLRFLKNTGQGRVGQRHS